MLKAARESLEQRKTRKPQKQQKQEQDLALACGHISKTREAEGVGSVVVGFGGWGGGKLFYLQLELLCLQLSFFARSPLRPLSDALSHCEQKKLQL